MPTDTPLTNAHLVEVLLACRGPWPAGLSRESFRTELARRLDGNAPELARRLRRSGRALEALGWQIDTAYALACPDETPDPFPAPAEALTAHA